MKASPENVHYFFVSLIAPTKATANTTAMQAPITKLSRPAEALGDAAAHWKTHLHVVAGNVSPSIVGPRRARRLGAAGLLHRPARSASAASATSPT